MKQSSVCSKICFALIAVTIASVMKADRRAEAAKPDTETLLIHPGSEPDPLLAYRLFPSAFEMVDGNAAVHYQRAVACADVPMEIEERFEKRDEWLGLPLQEFPLKQAKAFLAAVKYTRIIMELQKGNRCRDCNWRTLSEDLLPQEPRELMFSDQLMGNYWNPFYPVSEVLELALFVQIKHKKVHEALTLVSTGLSFAHRLLESGSLSNFYSGSQLSHSMLEKLYYLISLPDTPNLYWALSDLPRPFMSCKNVVENQCMRWRRLYTSLYKADRSEILISEIKELLTHEAFPFNTMKSRKAPGHVKAVFAIKLYPDAKMYLIKKGWNRETVNSMDRLRVIALFLTSKRRLLTHRILTLLSLPRHKWGNRYTRLANDITGLRVDLYAFSNWERFFLEDIYAVFESLVNKEGVIDRQVAALRCIEAIRLYRGTHKGGMPASLEELSVPVPVDPLSGTGFQYTKEAKRSTLSAPSVPSGRTEHPAFQKHLIPET